MFREVNFPFTHAFFFSDNYVGVSVCFILSYYFNQVNSLLFVSPSVSL